MGTESLVAGVRKLSLCCHSLCRHGRLRVLFRMLRLLRKPSRLAAESNIKRSLSKAHSMRRSIVGPSHAFSRLPSLASFYETVSLCPQNTTFNHNVPTLSSSRVVHACDFSETWGLCLSTRGIFGSLAS